MTTHYNGSRGPVEISSMIYSHLVNAHGKLVRERIDDTRDAEIDAMGARIAALDVEFEAEQAAGQPSSAETL